ncbi:MAG: hypothetical protein KGN02_05040 [bacterium]|nr:hypothetical protein [bacterium]
MPVGSVWGISRPEPERTPASSTLHVEDALVLPYHTVDYDNCCHRDGRS